MQASAKVYSDHNIFSGVLGKLCCVALSFCCVVLPSLPF